MNEIIIKKDTFDFDSFVDNIYEFINGIYGIDPAILIQNVEKPCMTNKEASKILQNRNSKDLLNELENGKDLYFPFTQAQITADSDKIKSVDGTQYDIKNNLENLLVNYDTIGYIVSLQDSSLQFKSGIHKIITQNNTSSPTEEIKQITNNNYEQFYEPMEAYLKKFIKR
jgi:hypothetical protein